MSGWMSERSWPLDALPRGTSLFGYQVEAVLGRGGFGITYRARDKIDQQFAVKECFPRQFACRQGAQVHPTDSGDAGPLAECLARFTREAKALTQLSRLGAAGEDVVKVHTFFEANNTAYIVMEFLDGGSLESCIAANPGGITMEQLGTIMPRLLHALGCVHAAGLLHRDVKPANIIIRPDGRPVLIDFGAVRAASGGQSVSFSQIYSEGFGPIEQFSGAQQGPFSDLYAFGMTCYRAIGGHTVDAFSRQQALLRGRPDPLTRAVEVGERRYPLNLLRAIDHAICVAPHERPQSAAELLDGLRDREATVEIRTARPTQVSVEPPKVAKGTEAGTAAPRLRLVATEVVAIGVGACSLIGVCGLVLFVAWPRHVQTPAQAILPAVHTARLPAAAPVVAVAPPPLMPAQPDAAQAALARVGELPPALINFALVGIGVLSSHAKDRTDDAVGHATAAWQSSIGAAPTGTLTPQQTVALIEAAADAGQAESENTLGMMRASGIGVTRDDAAAVGWFTKAATSSGQGKFNLALMVRDGRGVALDLPLARGLLAEAQMDGYPAAATLARTPMADADTSLARTKEIPPTLVQYALAGAGDFTERPDGHFGSSARDAIIRWQSGLGLVADGVLTPVQTVALVAVAAASGQVESLNTMGVMFASGIGVAQEDHVAARCFGKAAEKSAQGKYNLALMLKDGRGVPQDTDRATSLLKEAQAEGYGPATAALAR
jgi:TPR repeat protein